MTSCTVESLSAKITALEKMLDEREERTKERFIAMEKQNTQALAAADKAIDKSEQANLRHFNAQNEFRASLEDQTQTYMRTEVYNVQHKALADVIATNSAKIIDIEKRLYAMAELHNTKQEGIGNAYVVGALLFAGLGFFMSLAEVIYNMIVYLHKP